MRPRNLIVIAALLVTTAALGTGQAKGGGGQRWPTKETQGTPAAPPPASAPQPRERTAEPRRPSPPPATSTPAPDRGGKTGGRDGDYRRAPRPGEDERVAVPRPTPPPGARGSGIRTVPRGGNTVYVAPHYYYYPRSLYPYGYGAFGLGYFYYNPYAWYPGPGYYSGFGMTYPLAESGNVTTFGTGEIRLAVTPRDAQVFVDGFFAGSVDDYDGTFQSLTLDAGPHRIEIVAPGYETLAVDIRITAAQKITYRGELVRQR